MDWISKRRTLGDTLHNNKKSYDDESNTKAHRPILDVEV